jgi:hypothetical protein
MRQKYVEFSVIVRLAKDEQLSEETGIRLITEMRDIAEAEGLDIVYFDLERGEQ